MRREMHPQAAERTAGSAAAGPRPRPAHAAPCRPDSAVKRVAQRRASGRSAAQRGLHGLSQGCAWLARQRVWTAGACVACATSARSNVVACAPSPSVVSAARSRSDGVVPRAWRRAGVRSAEARTLRRARTTPRRFAGCSGAAGARSRTSQACQARAKRAGDCRQRRAAGARAQVAGSARDGLAGVFHTPPAGQDARQRPGQGAVADGVHQRDWPAGAHRRAGG